MPPVAAEPNSRTSSGLHADRTQLNFLSTIEAASWVGTGFGRKIPIHLMLP